MTLAEISNFRGLREGVLELPEVGDEAGRIILVLGHNYAGKSSVLSAIARAASQVRYKNKDESKEDLKRGEASGYVRLVKDDRETVLTVPDGEFTGEAVFASPVAVGLANLAETKKESDRFALLSQALKSEPTFEELKTELTKAGYTEVDAKNAWKLICPPATNRADWPKAYQEYYNSRTKLSGRWCEVTGRRQYSKEPWAPEGFSREDLLTIEPDDLSKELAAAQEELQSLSAGQAVNEHQRAELERKAASIAGLEKKLAQCRKDGTELKKQLEALKGTITDYVECSCWDCGAAQYIIDGASVDPEQVTVDPEGKEKRKSIEEGLAKATAQYRQLQSEIEAAKEAAQQISSLDGVDTDAIVAAEENLEAVQAKMNAYAAFCRAEEISKEVQKTDVLKNLTASNGLPGKKLHSSIREFNKLLKEICAEGNWAPVQIAEGDAQVLQDGYPYHTRSTSEQFRTRVALQLAFARYDGSELVVIDDAELLDAQDGGLPGLIYALDRMDMPAIVGCMANSKDHAGFLSEVLEMDDGNYFYGRRYWVDNEIVEPLEEMVATTT